MTLIMANLKELQREIAGIKNRNAKVEADKAWETSYVNGHY